MAINSLSARAVFLDKDGTLIEDVPYNIDPAQISLTDGALEGLQLLHSAGFKLVVVSNQSGVARGIFKEEALTQVEQHLQKILAEAGIPLAGFYYCPHHPEGRIRDYAVNCMCRKPRPGMLFKAARDHEINLASSWLIGDILDDVEAGRRADCNTILIENGNETEWGLTSPYRKPHYTAPNLFEAARIIHKIVMPPSLGTHKNMGTHTGAAI
jgi:D-glycero-D-manno-heptose 1,7-bisphosphate phosphatase